MKINRQLTLILLGSVLFVTLVTTITSYYILSKMQENAAYNFLTTTSRVADSIAAEQTKEFLATSSSSIISSLKDEITQGDTTELNEYVNSLSSSVPNLSFAIIADNTGQQITSTASVAPDAAECFRRYFNEIDNQNIPSISSMDIEHLPDIFDADSASYQKYLIKSSTGEDVTTALANVTVVSLDGGGFLVCGEIVNNNSHYPNEYTSQVTGSYLSYVVGGFRVSTSLVPVNNTVSQVGKPIPIGLSDLTDGTYRGQELSPAGYQYYYLYTRIDNYWKEGIACKGVGIRETVYSNLIHNNMKAILLVTIVICPIIFIIGWLFSSRITRPLKVGKKMTECITAGDFAAVNDFEITKNPINESDQLVTALHDMALGLNESREQIQKYVKELKESNEAANDLSRQLLQANTGLEQTVQARTLELQQLVDKLKISNSTKSQFIANISHELKTPLVSSISASEILLDEMFGDLNSKQRDYIETIRLSSSHLLLLIEDILAVAKIDEGKANLKYEMTTISALLEEVIDVVRGSDPERASDIRTSVTPADLKVMADRIALRQILYNLLSNAVKFSDPGGGIEVIARSRFIEGKRVADFSIIDHGIGIDTSDLERVFYEFEQVENSHSRTYEGTGLGLPLARRQAELHSGKLWLESELGVGTVARFYIPIDQDDTSETRRISGDADD